MQLNNLSKIMSQMPFVQLYNTSAKPVGVRSTERAMKAVHHSIIWALLESCSISGFACSHCLVIFFLGEKQHENVLRLRLDILSNPIIAHSTPQLHRVPVWLRGVQDGS